MSAQHTVTDLVRQMQKETNPATLREIALQLRDLGAWVEQYEAERKAHDEEVKQAVEA